MLMTCLTIIAMAVVTYITRIAGYFLFRNAQMSARTVQIMEAAPGCVLIAVIAPYFATGHLADMLALAITIVAASRFPLLITVLAGVSSAGVLRWLLPI